MLVLCGPWVVLVLFVGRKLIKRPERKEQQEHQEHQERQERQERQAREAAAQRLRAATHKNGLVTTDDEAA